MLNAMTLMMRTMSAQVLMMLTTIMTTILMMLTMGGYDD